MDPRLQNRIQRYGWDRAAELYDAGWSEQLRPAQDLMVDMAAPQPGESAIDVACGTGGVTLRVADLVGPNGKAVGADISDQMVALATRNAQGRSNVTFVRAAADELELPDASFDLALCALGLMYVADPATALVRIRRALRRQGRAAAAVWGARSRCGWASVFPIVDAQVCSEVCPLFFRLGTGDTLAHEFRSAGFVSVEDRRISVLLRYRDADDAVQAAFAGGPVAMAWSRFDEATRRGVAEEYLASIESFRSDEGYAIPGEFVVVRGRCGEVVE